MQFFRLPDKIDLVGIEIELTPVTIGIAIVAMILLLVVASALLRFIKSLFKPKRAHSHSDDLAGGPIKLSDIDNVSPVPAAPKIDVYHIPVRVVLLVVAPLGRGHRLPDEDKLPKFLDELMPGLMNVMQVHQTEIRHWQSQLSSSGFTNMFFSQVPLPGEHGKGTPWCAVAGRVESPAGNFAIGFVGRADEDNGLTQIEIPQQTGWLDVVRIY